MEGAAPRFWSLKKMCVECAGPPSPPCVTQWHGGVSVSGGDAPPHADDHTTATSIRTTTANSHGRFLSPRPSKCCLSSSSQHDECFCLTWLTSQIPVTGVIFAQCFTFSTFNFSLRIFRLEVKVHFGKNPIMITRCIDIVVRHFILKYVNL